MLVFSNSNIPGKFPLLLNGKILEYIILITIYAAEMNVKITHDSVCSFRLVSKNSYYFLQLNIRVEGEAEQRTSKISWKKFFFPESSFIVIFIPIVHDIKIFFTFKISFFRFLSSRYTNQRFSEKIGKSLVSLQFSKIKF